jgi:hypothetical protein
MQYLRLKHKILVGFFMFLGNTKMLCIKYPSLMIKKKYNDSFKFFYNKNKIK